MKKFTIETINEDSDFDAITDVYYQTWRTSYKGVLSQRLLEKITDDKPWQPEKRIHNTFVAVSDDGKIVGVCSYGPSRQKDMVGFGEIYSIYVLPEWQNLGVGHALFLKALEKLESAYDEIFLVVIQQNTSAIDFYKSFGFIDINKNLRQQTEFGILNEIVLTYHKGASH